MKGRESGMPAESCWAQFFNAEALLDCLVLPHIGAADIVEFGTGYGTFTLALAQKTSATIHSLDIEPELIELVSQKSRRLGLHNIRLQQRDFIAHGTGLAAASASHVMIYNLLHVEDPHQLLQEAHRLLQPGGALSVIHWRCDVPTPRGPPLAIRPTAQQCIAWAQNAGLTHPRTIAINHACPWHYGFLAFKP